MTSVRRHIAPSILAGAILVAPYAFLAGTLLALLSAAPNDPVRTSHSIVVSSFVIGLALDVLMSLVPAMFFSIARHSWTTEGKIVTEHLFGWPIGTAIVAGMSTCVLLMQETFRLSLAWSASISLLLTVCAAGCGLVAAFVWRRLAYP